MFKKMLSRYAKEMEAWELARLQKDDRFGIGLFICLIENGFVGAHCIIICQTTFNGNNYN